MDRGDVAPLRREVEPPHRQPNGLGVMLIASAAMFFAVAGSAFVVRARMAGHCCDRTHAPVRVEAAPRAPALLTQPDETCGAPVYRNHPDGTVAVSFRLCPTSTAAK
ncbi:MAG TPA: hypothetical protein VMZ28_17275 [Kofleriaceae bacterium]|nr:hypothetical protein [Kofleriaceae bacterium]